MSDSSDTLKDRFRGYFPVVIDVETAGFNAHNDALLEIAAVTLQMDDQGLLHPHHTVHHHVVPFEGANLEPAALEFNGIDPHCPLRGALEESEVMKDLCKNIRKYQKEAQCQRSVIVAHNAAFDQGFVNAAIERSKIKRTPFHPFVSFDTTTLAGLAVGQTVLVKACREAGIPFDQNEAHSALYDAQRTAELFCFIANRYRELGGWPLTKS
ncbi:ribonuclease T [Alteromonas sp. C1M14]|uniref:ribonuclease T n=1 Tax=Alteromonas sp. C1M14 TaxID=2841567 RepID=UPI001C092182|nr:ribonuclease T [Alteromonas sp. C1M14]MBU2978078.1 ribonuclease T [Alteromonas sp. C1M14]